MDLPGLIQQLDAGDKRGRKWELDVRRALSNAGHLANEVVGCVAFHSPDGKLKSIGLKANGAN